jgi:hypothetical protein
MRNQDTNLKNDAAQSERLLTEAQAAWYLGLDDRPNPIGSLRWLCRTRRLTFVRLARGIRRFRQQDLNAFVDRAMVASVD